MGRRPRDASYIIPTSCPKVIHSAEHGYFHEEWDDGPYTVDGVDYCGRCHRAVPCGGERRSAEPERVVLADFDSNGQFVTIHFPVRLPDGRYRIIAERVEEENHA